MYRNGTGTVLRAQGSLRDANLVRWHADDGKILRIGGWQERGTVDFSGTVRGMLAWEDNSGNRYNAAGMHDALKVMTSGNTIYDITPTSGFTSGKTYSLN